MNSLIKVSKRSFAQSLYLWGAMPRLGPKATDLKQQFQIPKGIPHRIQATDALNVQKVFIGVRHSALISGQGDLYTFGSGNWGVLGHGNEKDVKFESPKLVEYFTKHNLKIVDVALGEYHSIALANDGNVYTWGYGGKKGFFNWMYTQEIGGLGHGDKEPHFAPKRVDYFKKNNIQIKSISAGLYHCLALTTDNHLYSWGRGLYGVLGNGTNKYCLEPEINGEFEFMMNEDPGFTVIKMDSADEFSAVKCQNGSTFSWGKNDRGQMGIGTGIGIDMVESENQPTTIKCINKNEEEVEVDSFSLGQNTMILKDVENRIYKTGLKLDYTPTPLTFFDEFISENIIDIACGRRHYVVLNGRSITNKLVMYLNETLEENQLLVWGSVFKEKPAQISDGFGLYHGDNLFNNGKVKSLSMRYGVFGAIVDHP